MTGREVRDLRNDLGISREVFAACLGVATSSVYRWEDHKFARKQIRMDPFHHSLLLKMQAEFESCGPDDIELLGKKLVEAGLLNGALYSTYRLLKFLFTVR